MMKNMLLVSACFLFLVTVNAEQRESSYSHLINSLLSRIKDYRRGEEDYNVRKKDQNVLKNLVLNNVEKDEELLNGRAYDYDSLLGHDDEYERSKIPLPVHEDEDESEDIVDENLNEYDNDEHFPMRSALKLGYHNDLESGVQRSMFNKDSSSTKKSGYHKDVSLKDETNVHQKADNHKAEISISNHVEPITETHTIRMPDVSPQQMDTYLCFAYELPADDRYIVEFTPLAKMQVAHHMLLFGCEVPFKTKVSWNCREMQPVCGRGRQHIMYAWAKDAPSLTMPENVGFHVGKNSGVNYLVLQVHYLHVDQFKNGGTDASGLKFQLTEQRKRFLSGIYLLADGWTPIPPHKERSHIDMGFKYPGDAPRIEPFRFRTHAHKLGVVITGYRIRNNKWTLIGRGDPQRPQAFYKVFNDVDVQPGDVILGRCTYNSMSRNDTTFIGATHKDEMCNFYIMYFYDSDNQTTNNIECIPVETSKYQYPADSDIALAVMEKQNKKKAGVVSKINNNATLTLYKEVLRWPQNGVGNGELPMTVGQVTGVAVDDKKNEVLIFQRGHRVWDAATFDRKNNIRMDYHKPIKQKTLIWLDRDTGVIKRAAGGRMFSMPHGVTIDHEGYIWVTDVGAHQVFKLSSKVDPKTKELKVLLSLGERFVKGSDAKHFCKPTDVAVMKDGSFFVADGYCNSRVLKFDAEGTVMMEISESLFKAIYNFPAPTYMNVVHSLALDVDGKKLYVADRENGRILEFNADSGEYLSYVSSDKFDNGAVYAIAFNKHNDGVLHVVNGPRNNQPINPSGFTYSLKKEKVIGKWRPKEGLNHPHDIAVTDNNHDIFAAEIGPNRIWKFKSTKTRP